MCCYHCCKAVHKILPCFALNPLLPPPFSSLPLSQAFGGSGSYQWLLAEKNGVIAVNSGGVSLH